MSNILFASIIFLIAYLAGYLTIYRQTYEASINLEAFATGIFLGAAIFHMLPDATRQFHHMTTHHFPWAIIICLLSIGLMSLLSKMVRLRQSMLTPQLLSGLLVTCMLSLHSLVEGVTLGLVQQFSVILIVFIAIAFHKGAASFALATHLLRNQYSQTYCHRTILLFSLLTPLGILIGSTSQRMVSTGMGGWLDAIFLAITAGTFLYIAIFEYIAHWLGMPQKNLGHRFITCCCGIALMATLALWL